MTEAEKLFARKGFDATGIEEIAQKVGIRKSVIYYHFKNKEEILHTLLRDFLDKAITFKKEQFERYMANPAETKQRIAETLSEFSRNSRILRILLMESLKRDTDLPIFEALDLNADVVKEMLERMSQTDVEPNWRSLYQEAFFLVLLPTFGYYVFLEHWCAHYGVDRSEAEDNFAEMMTWFYSVWLKRWFDASQTTVNRDQKPESDGEPLHE